MTRLNCLLIIRLCAFLFTLLFLILSFYNVPATDDYHFLHNLHEYGIWQGMVHEYSNWSPRFASVLITHFILWIQEMTGFGYFIFGVLSLLLVTTAIHCFLLSVEHFFENDIINLFRERTKVDQIAVSLFVASIWFLGTLRIGETWFWLCSASTYLWSNAFFLILVSQLIKSGKLWSDYPILFLSCFFIGGSCGPLSLITLTLLVLLLITNLFEFIKKGKSSGIIPKLTFATVILSIFFYFQYIANGNRVRETFFDQISLVESLILNIKITGIILIKRIPLSLLIDLILTFPVIKLISTRNESEPAKWIKCLTALTSIYLLTIFLFQWSITYKTQDVGAYRTLLFIQTLTLIYSGMFWILTAKYGFRKRLLGMQKKISFGLLTIYTITLSVLLINQIIATEKYHEACIERTEYVKRTCYNKNVTEVNPLPTSGLLYSAELSTDTSYFSNVHYKQGLNLDCAVRRKKLFPE